MFSMKKILIITTVSGFLYKFEMDNVRILRELGYEVHYAANEYVPNYIYDKEELTRNGVIFHHIDIYQSPYERKQNRIALKQLKAIVRDEGIGYIHCHTPVGGMLGRMLGKDYKSTGIKVIYTTHGFHFYAGAPLKNRLIFYNAERMFAKYTDILITINSEDYVNARKFRLKPGGQVFKIPGVGLDLKKFFPISEEKRKEFRNNLGISDDTFFLLSVGEFSRNKNHISVIRMLSEMKRDGEDLSRIRYGICGEGYYRADLENKVKEAGLEDVITFYGYRTPVQPFIGAADALIFPSRREGLGMAALEALAMGVPVIAADNRGTREYMIHGENGYICPWNDITGYRENLKKLMSLTAEELKRMKDFCVRSTEPFDRKYVSLIMRGIYERLDQDTLKR